MPAFFVDAQRLWDAGWPQPASPDHPGRPGRAWGFRSLVIQHERSGLHGFLEDFFVCGIAVLAGVPGDVRALLGVADALGSTSAPELRRHAGPGERPGPRAVHVVRSPAAGCQVAVWAATSGDTGRVLAPAGTALLVDPRRVELRWSAAAPPLVVYCDLVEQELEARLRDVAPA